MWRGWSTSSTACLLGGGGLQIPVRDCGRNAVEVFFPGMVVVDMVEVDGPSSTEKASDSELGIEGVTDKRDVKGRTRISAWVVGPFLLVSARVVAPSSLTDVNENDVTLLP